jgi:hypothetical protein
LHFVSGKEAAGRGDGHAGTFGFGIIALLALGGCSEDRTDQPQMDADERR